MSFSLSEVVGRRGVGSYSWEREEGSMEVLVARGDGLNADVLLLDDSGRSGCACSGRQRNGLGCMEMALWRSVMVGR